MIFPALAIYRDNNSGYLAILVLIILSKECLSQNSTSANSVKQQQDNNNYYHQQQNDNALAKLVKMFSKPGAFKQVSNSYFFFFFTCEISIFTDHVVCTYIHFPPEGFFIYVIRSNCAITRKIYIFFSSIFRNLQKFL